MDDQPLELKWLTIEPHGWIEGSFIIQSDIFFIPVPSTALIFKDGEHKGKSFFISRVVYVDKEDKSSIVQGEWH